MTFPLLSSYAYSTVNNITFPCIVMIPLTEDKKNYPFPLLDYE